MTSYRVLADFDGAINGVVVDDAPDRGQAKKTLGRLLKMSRIKCVHVRPVQDTTQEDDGDE